MEQSSQEAMSETEEALSQSMDDSAEAQSIEDMQLELVTQESLVQADMETALRLQLSECVESRQTNETNLQIAEDLQMSEAIGASRSNHLNRSNNLASHVDEFISQSSRNSSQGQQSSQDSGLGSELTYNGIQLDGEIDTSTDTSYESTFTQIQSLIENPTLLRTHPKRAEIEKILSCDDKQKLIEFIADLIEQRLQTTLQRIRRKMVYIVSYRKHQLENSWVAVDGHFNKYITTHPERPIYSAKSMLKLIRWCRYFEREYRPVTTVATTAKFPDYKEHVQTIEQLKVNRFPRNCFICRIDDYCQLEDGTPFCQPCLYRKMLFLHGSTLQCCECSTSLNDDKFEFWADKNWCKSCLWSHCFENRLVEYG